MLTHALCSDQNLTHVKYFGISNLLFCTWKVVNHTRQLEDLSNSNLQLDRITCDNRRGFISVVILVAANITTCKSWNIVFKIIMYNISKIIHAKSATKLTSELLLTILENVDPNRFLKNKIQKHKFDFDS